MYGKGFVASCHASINCVTLWKNSLLSLSLQCHVIRVFQAGEQNLEKVTIQNIGFYQLMRKRVGKYLGPLTAGNMLGCYTMHEARVSDFFVLIFATEI